MKSWPIIAVETEMRRLKVLQYLGRLPSYEASATILCLHCRQVGVPTSTDQLASALAFLEEAELIAIRTVQDEPIAKLTKAGLEVSIGVRDVPGVFRPDP